MFLSHEFRDFISNINLQTHLEVQQLILNEHILMSVVFCFSLHLDSNLYQLNAIMPYVSNSTDLFLVFIFLRILYMSSLFDFISLLLCLPVLPLLHIPYRFSNLWPLLMTFYYMYIHIHLYTHTYTLYT